MRHCSRCRRTTTGEEPSCIVCDGPTAPVDLSALAARHRRLPLTLITLAAVAVTVAGVAVGRWMSVTAPAATTLPAPAMSSSPPVGEPATSPPTHTPTPAPSSSTGTPAPAPVATLPGTPLGDPSTLSSPPPAAPTGPPPVTCPTGLVVLSAAPALTGTASPGQPAGTSRRMSVTLTVVNDTTAPVDNIFVRVESAGRLFTFAVAGPLRPGDTARQTYGGYPLRPADRDPDTASVLTADLNWATSRDLDCAPPRIR